MKEKIYTIPVMDAFKLDCECPFCELETRLEDEMVSDILGAALMEPDIRQETNKKGFCREHFAQLYNSEENRLGLGLIIDTHMQEYNKKLKDAAEDNKVKDAIKSLFGKGNASGVKNTIDNVIAFLDDYASTCYICDKLDFTMGRYVDITFYLYFSEPEFRSLFQSRKGFCLSHLRDLLEYARKLDSKKAAEIVKVILDMQVTNMQRVQEEVNWFTKKFDYRYDKEPWGNSKDAIPRSIKKLIGACRLKK